MESPATAHTRRTHNVRRPPKTKYTTLLASEEDTAEPKRPHSTSRKGCRIGLHTKSAWLSYGCLVLVTLAIFIMLLTWIASSAQRGIFADLLAPAVIGGKFTYTQAKAIDFVSSALFGPLVMVILDLLWFRSARTTIVNERYEPDGVPLPSLVYASNTGAGGFDLIKLKSLFTAGTWRMILFGLLVGLSGTAGKLINNVIAYQAFTSNINARNQTFLRVLSGAAMLSYDSLPPIEVSPFYAGPGGGLYELSVHQRASLTNQIAALLTGLNFESAEPKLEGDSSYIGINATLASLNGLHPNIVQLTDIPAYRLAVDCEPFKAGSISRAQTSDTTTVLDLSGQDKREELFSAVVPGAISLTMARTVPYTFVAFSNSTYLGTLLSSDSTGPKYWIKSSYGTVMPYASTIGGGSPEKGIATTWGINCTIWRQEGLVNLSRPLGGSWSRSKGTFPPTKRRVSSGLQDFQELNYNTPRAPIPGLGPPLSETAGGTAPHWACPDCDEPKPLNFTKYALNYLYASGEARRIFYEVLASDNSSTLDLFYEVTATASVEFYRITYIPLLLLLALVASLLAAMIPVILASSALRTTTFQTSRDLNGVRFVVDAVAGLQDSASEMSDAAAKKGEDLLAWAKGVRVRLALMDDGKDSAAIKLIRVEKEELER